MMRAMDQDTGFRVTVDRLVEQLLQFGDTQYFLYYRTPKWFGRFAGHTNAVERLLLRPRHKILWDQVAVPLSAYRDRVDLIFNPKFSVPLVSPCRVTMGLQEPSWWRWPKHHPWWDVAYMRFALPLYVRRASHLFPMSQFILDENKKYLGHALSNSTVILSAPESSFRDTPSQESVARVRDKYHLPNQFVFSSTRVENLGNSGATFCETKNIETAVRAYSLWKEHVDRPLVVAGRNVREFLIHRGWKEDALVGIHFLGLVAREDMSILYHLADACVMPSWYEGCPLTILEAMAAGCPVIASDIAPFRELGKDSALYADPNSAEQYAECVARVAKDSELNARLRTSGVERSRDFSWEGVAARVQEGFRLAVNAPNSGASIQAPQTRIQVGDPSP